MSDHQRAPGFFTIVAGTCVLGAQNVVAFGARDVALALWWVGLILWFGIMHAFFTAVAVQARKPTLACGISGAWLIAAVSTQSDLALRRRPSQCLAVAFFLIGCMLYRAITPLIFHRLTFAPMNREDFSPPCWIHMGAAAIAALAGSILIQRGGVWRLLDPLPPFLCGFTFFRAVASWRVPFLFALMPWRCVRLGDRFTCEPAIWGMAISLGIYATSAFRCDRAVSCGFLDPVPGVAVFIALGAGLPGVAGMMRRLRAAAVANRRAG